MFSVALRSAWDKQRLCHQQQPTGRDGMEEEMGWPCCISACGTQAMALVVNPAAWAPHCSKQLGKSHFKIAAALIVSAAGANKFRPFLLHPAPRTAIACCHVHNLFKEFICVTRQRWLFPPLSHSPPHCRMTLGKGTCAANHCKQKYCKWASIITPQEKWALHCSSKYCGSLNCPAPLL